MSSTENEKVAMSSGHDAGLGGISKEAEVQQASALEVDEAHHAGGHGADLDTGAKMSDYKADAIAAEDAEHRMTVLQAVRAYPMASFWAFVFSFLIVRIPC
jgi:MFS transporter, SP family, general alpha glucoside:H+ symporter